ncbi:hypothetical protein PSN45_005218 [Yamadazyma tenuis]|nr:hypothetical protein PSN45_005218 [Yamadazyma tenuis]
MPMLLTPFVLLEWYIWSYSLCYSSSSNHFIGDLDFAVLRQLRESAVLVYATPRGEILSINHFLFNGMFKIICVGFTFPGCIAERGRLLPMLLFLFCWSTIIYNPVTYWFWNRNGWLSTEFGTLPVTDFAGGNCIHVVSGFTALAYSYLLGPRNSKLLYNYRSSNNGFILLGTFFIAFGWCGFIAGCDYKFSTFSIYIMVNSLLAASVSSVVWMIIDFYYSSTPLDGNGHNKSERKISIISFSSGLMAGLVVITPAGGYVSSPTGFWKAIVFGVIGGISSNLATRLKFFFHIDDAFDIFAIHGITGIVGSLLTGIFGESSYGSKGGWVEGNFIQICYQILGCVVTATYVFVMSLLFLYLIDWIPGFHLRIDKTFNKRMREQKLSNTHLNVQASLSPTNNGFDHDTAVGSIDTKFEHGELEGGDQYELNGEYMMDFMEFIKVIRPEDYTEDYAGIEHIPSSNQMMDLNRKIE